MPLSGSYLARRTKGGLEMRGEAVRLRLNLRDIATADVHLIDAVFVCSVRALDERGEREMFAETFLASKDLASVEDIAAHFIPPLHRGLCSFAKTQAAGRLLEDGSKQPIIEALLAAAKPVAFSSGVELLPPFDVVVTSRTVQRERMDEMERTLSQRRLAGQVENVQRAKELLKEFAALKEAMPHLSTGGLIQQVAPNDRGSMLQSLLMASAAEATAPLWAVAGPELLKIDPRATPAKVETIKLPADLGPLRSVRASEGKLLIGAQSGVMVVDPARPSEAVVLRAPKVSSQLGFNSVAVTGERVWASHSEAGVLRWEMASPNEPAVVMAAAARNVVALDDGRIVGSAGGMLFVTGEDGAVRSLCDSVGAILFIAATREHVIVVRAEGDVELFERGTLAPLSRKRMAGELTAAGVLPFVGSSRLLLATANGPVQCVGGDDPLVTQYLSSHKGLRAVTACADIVAALSGDRQRIVLWKSWAGETPFAEIHVAGIARHRAADICFA